MSEICFDAIASHPSFLVRPGGRNNTGPSSTSPNGGITISSRAEYGRANDAGPSPPVTNDAPAKPEKRFCHALFPLLPSLMYLPLPVTKCPAAAAAPMGLTSATATGKGNP